MKIIIGGAGNVAKSIVSYLSRSDNDIIVVDGNEANLHEMEREWDIQTVYGSVSHPDVLQKAGAENADLLIAVTGHDEVNMIACQAAYSLFNLPRKIARIDSRVYTKARWGNLFGDANMPVDLIVSPEYEIADYILNLLKIPGVSGVYPLAEKKLQMLSFRCPKKCPLVQIPLDHLEEAAPELKVHPVAIVRNNRGFLPQGDDVFKVGDEIYLLAQSEQLDAIVHGFGLNRKAGEKIVIFGGNQIAEYLAEAIEADDNILGCTIIDENADTAKDLAEHLNNTVVLNGPMMSNAVLDEAGMEYADASVAVTGDDKDNIIASMLAKKNGVENTVSLMNSRSYSANIVNIGENIVVDRTAVTIAVLLKELRRVNLNHAYPVGFDFGELWEINVDENSGLIGNRTDAIKLPEGVRILALCCDDETFFGRGEQVIAAGERLLVLVTSAAIRKAEKIFG